MADTTATATAPTTAADALKEQLLGQGLSEELLDSLDEPQLVLLFRDMQGEETAETPAPGDMADPAGMGRDELIAELVSLGRDEAELQGMTDDQLRALLAEERSKGTKTMSDPKKPLPAVAEIPAAGPGGQTPGPPADLERKFADLSATVKALERQAAATSAAQRAALAQEQARLKEASRARVYETCKKLRDTNQIEAWQMDESDPSTLSLPQQLLLLDATTPLTRTFADASGKEVKVTRTALDDALEAMKRWPVRKFSELAVRGQGTPEYDEAAAAKAAKEYAERRNKATKG